MKHKLYVFSGEKKLFLFLNRFDCLVHSAPLLARSHIHKLSPCARIVALISIVAHLLFASWVIQLQTRAVTWSHISAEAEIGVCVY